MNEQNASNFNESLNTATKPLLFSIFSTNSTSQNTTTASIDNNETSYVLQEYTLIPNNHNTTRLTTKSFLDILTTANHTKMMNSTGHVSSLNLSPTITSIKTTTTTSTITTTATAGTTSKKMDDFKVNEDFYDIDLSNVDSLLTKSKFQLVDKRKNNGRSSLSIQNGR